MPTVVGPWQGSTPSARIEIDYFINYNADHTQANVTAWLLLATDQSLFDSTNTWDAWGSLGIHAGSGVNYSHSGAGRTNFATISGWVGPSGADVGARVSGLEGVGVNVEAVLNIPVGGLAPYIQGSYSAVNISSSSFSGYGISAVDNGGVLNNLAMQVNTSATDVGSTYHEAGSWKNIDVSGLYRATTYYFRQRASNTTYGWGPWGPWVSFTTLTAAPSVPTGYSATEISQNSAVTQNVTVADNGGTALTNIRGQINTTATDVGSALVTKGSWGPLAFTGLVPGTKYYFRLAAGNARGWSTYGGWASFTTLPGVFVNIDDVWKNAQPYVNIEGVWKVAVRYVNIDGVWKQ